MSRPRWCQLGPDHHELRDGGAVVAELRGSTATFDGEEWHFDERDRFMSPSQVVVEKKGEPAARLTVGLEGDQAGAVLDANGSETGPVRWSGGASSWETEDDWVIRFHNDTDAWDEAEAEVEIVSSFREMPRLKLFVCVGFYLWLAHWRRAHDSIG